MRGEWTAGMSRNERCMGLTDDESTIQLVRQSERRGSVMSRCGRRALGTALAEWFWAGGMTAEEGGEDGCEKQG